MPKKCQFVQGVITLAEILLQMIKKTPVKFTPSFLKKLEGNSAYAVGG